jgi:hypothetical protein
MLLPALAGCVRDPEPAPEAWGRALDRNDELQRVSCPDLDPADKAALAARIARPAHWRKTGATKGGLLAHIDRLELGQETKIAAADRVLAEFERCRGGAEGAAAPAS